MKKTIITTITLILAIILIYNIKIYSGTLVCVNEFTEDNVSFKTTYQVEYNKKVVTKLISVETITTTDEDLIKDYKTNLEMMYLRYNEVPHYTNTISVKDNKLTSKTTINYKKIDLNKLIKIDSSFKEVIKDNKVSITKLKKQYTSTGAYCKYKD